MMFLKRLPKATLLLVLVVGLILPLTTFAGIPTFTPLDKDFPINITTIIESILNVIWPVVIAIIIVMFIWAGITFVTAQGDPTKIATAKKTVIWASVGVAVLAASYSMIKFITGIINPPIP